MKKKNETWLGMFAVWYRSFGQEKFVLHHRGAHGRWQLKIVRLEMRRKDHSTPKEHKREKSSIVYVVG